MKNNFPQLSVSILNSDMSNLTKTLNLLQKLDIKYVHLDVMDGNFVPNLTFGPAVIKSIRSKTKCILDTHLMIQSPQKTITQYFDAGCDIITFHYESLKESDIFKLIKLIKKHNKLVGISIKPPTSPTKIVKYLNYLDLVLVMTVSPGFGGQKIITSCIKKIQILKNLRDKKGYKYIISADGGINEKNVVEIIKKGCDLPVIGSAIFCSKDIDVKIKFLQSLIK
jgi:ribulose-phosphate 3-epimerase